MAKFVDNIEKIRTTGTINVYAVRYAHKNKTENFAVALPDNLNWQLRSDFCENIVKYKECREVRFNPTVDGVEDGTYEFIDLTNIQEECQQLFDLLNNFFDYRGENRKKVPLSNLYICELDFEGKKYFLCSRQIDKSDKILKGKVILFSNEDELDMRLPKDVFVLSPNTGFIIVPDEKKILIFDKKSFLAVFNYDNYQKEMVQKNITILKQWTFIENVDIIERKVEQKNVYRNLAKIFTDKKYLEQMKHTSPDTLKQNLLKRSPDNFKETDFQGDKLIVTDKNLQTVMKMLSKGFNYNFFTDVAEQI